MLELISLHYPVPSVLILVAIFFITCVITVVTGATALITVPAMILIGIPVRTALAINMVTLTFLSTGGALPFWGKGEIDRRRLPRLIGLTLAGSVAGTLLVFIVPAQVLPAVIPFAMLAVLIFLVAQPRAGVTPRAPTPGQIRTGYALALLLGIYAGFLSGGYVTMMIATCVFCFGYPFLRAMAMTRLMNVASSLIATCIFAWNGAVDWPLALILGLSAFAGGFTGSHVARRVPEKLLRGVFIAAVVGLAVKSLIYDVFSRG
jgi:uncharacterized membrane protein YfcA